MRKIFNFLLIIFFAGMIAIAEPASSQNSKQEYTPAYIEKSSFPISVIDPTPSTNPVGSYYPGLRAANQLVIYTPKYGKRTETNEFGSETIVVKNTVVDFSGNNSLIPEDGYVISGHGKAGKWIKQNLIEGSTVNINSKENTIESAITPESYIFRANQKISQVRQLIKEYKKSPNYTSREAQDYLNKAAKNIAESRKYIKTKDYDNAKQSANTAASMADYALYYTIPAKAGELHGVWLRPTEKNKEQIIQTLDKLQKTGIQNVFVETYYQGYTIFPSETLAGYGVIPQKREFSGWDPLKVWIDEAHKRNMKIHVWFQTFYAGNEDISRNYRHILSIHPNWSNVQLKNSAFENPMPSRSEHNGYFLDPANPEVQGYLITLLSEIINNYDVDGINIDYIRYPVSLPANFPGYLDSSWGYSNYARNEFKSIYGIDPVNLTLQDSLWSVWTAYRQNKVTEFVSKIKPLARGKNILISAVIFPNIEESSVNKLQNWKSWGENRYVDAFTPLVMGSDQALAEDYVKQIKSSSNVQVLPGLFEPFTSGTPADLLLQIKSARESGASGMVIFDYAHLSKDFLEALGARIFK